MKNLTLRRMLFWHAFLLLGSIFILCTILYTAFFTGVQHKLYSFADSEEKQVEQLIQRINVEKSFNPKWVPENVNYTLIDSKNQVISSNSSPAHQKRAQAFLKGERNSHADGHFLTASSPEGSCVFEYHIGVRYSSDWANQHLPRLEMLMVFTILLIVLIPTAVFVYTITHRLYKNITPLKTTINSIKQGNLDLPVPSLSIEEFKELGILTNRMRLDLKNTLGMLWDNEQRMKEETTRMLHDYRSPLTVARANAEFLKEDLSRANGMPDKTELLGYVKALILNLERLSEVADQLQQHMDHHKKASFTAHESNFNELNDALDYLGITLSKHYQGTWESQIQKTQEPMPVEEKVLKQLLANILNNAFEHGQAPQTVRLQFTVQPTTAEYLIINTGSCFSEKALHHAEEKGFSEKQKDGQYLKGMGLYFVHRFLQECGGKMSLSNTLDGYASVRVTIPLRPVKQL